MPPKLALGEERRRAPCLPPHIFASLLALPIEHDRHGHPGLLYARRSGSAELESWIEARMRSMRTSMLHDACFGRVLKGVG